VHEARPPTLAIIDDHAAVREALAQLLRAEGFTVVGLAGDAQAGRGLVVRRRPSVAVIDIRLPGDSGLELTTRLLGELPQLRVLLYTGERIEAALLDRLLESGALGVALKTGDARDLTEAIGRVAAGERYVDRRLGGTPDGCGRSPVSALSEREREVLRMIGAGHSNSAIAKQLYLSPHTVRTHVRNALRKLGVSTRAQAVLALERAELRI
jgi:two-component system, NarL family, response regulator DevR